MWKKWAYILPWSPVGGSFRYKKLLEIKSLVELAIKKGCCVYALILAWIRLKSPCVIPIPGASKISSIENSVESLKITLDKNEMAYIDGISEEEDYEDEGQDLDED